MSVEKGQIVWARAKINLYLEIEGLREDGFHNLYSLFVPSDWVDEIFFTALPEEKLIFSCTDERLSNEDNTVYQAAKALLEYRGNKKGVSILLNKKVPYEAGLGSASSDAVATLLFLNKYWECNLSEEKLKQIALKIGSDTSFFFYNTPAIVQGRGEKIIPLSFSPKLFLLTIKPKNLSISTTKAYQILKESRAYTCHKTRREKLLEALQQNHISVFAKLCFNGFEESLVSTYPLLKEMKNYFQQSGALNSVLSGSGSAMTGIYKNEDQLFAAENFFQKLEKSFDFQKTII